MKKYLLTLCLMLASLVAWANPVSRQTAVTVAENFATTLGISVKENSVRDITPDGTFRQMYFFEFDRAEGFVIVAADDRVLPILGYSVNSTLQPYDMPQHVQEWFQDYEDQIEYLIANNVAPSAKVMNEWSALLNPSTPPTNSSSTQVGPLVTTTWSQGTYYNNLCPYDNSLQAVTGCVATAMGQLMKYWNHPTSGRGSHSYVWNNQTLSANFGTTTYDWANMPNSLTSSSTSTQVSAVATLLYQAGVSVDMDYSSRVSYAYQHIDGALRPSAETALQVHFGYSNRIRSLNYSDVTDAQWKTILKGELDSGRVMMYAGSGNDGGHSFICDGYDANDRFHFNWGWGGMDDGFFAIGQLNTSLGTFNLRNSVLIGIEPEDDTPLTYSVITATSSDNAVGTVTGSGIYDPYDTARIVASCIETYRFDHWNDNDRANPRYVFANSPSFNIVAYYSPLPTDTLGYCSEEYSVSFNANQWGIRYPAAALAADRWLTSVRMMIHVAGQYTIKIYQGDGPQMTLEYSQQFTSSVVDKWIERRLTTPYAINTTRSLWITLEFTGSGRPALASGKYSGNGNGMMYYDGNISSWVSGKDDGYYYTWMIKGITKNDTTADTIYVTATSTSGTGYNSGTGIYEVEILNSDYRFRFPVNLPAGVTDIVDGQTYSLSDMNSDSAYCDDLRNGQLINYASCSMTRNTFGDYDATVTANDRTVYIINYIEPRPITEVKDTVYISINNRATCVVGDYISGYKFFKLTGTDSVDNYKLSIVFNSTTQMAGTYTTTDISNKQASLTDNATRRKIQFRNLLPDAVVTGDKDSCHAIIHYVSSDSVLYEITFDYSNPVPAVRDTFVATDLSIVRNWEYEAEDNHGAFELFASDGTYTMSGFVLNDSTGSPFGSWNIGGLITFDMTNDSDETSFTAYSGVINITLADSLYILTGSVLFHGDIEFTYNVTGIRPTPYIATANPTNGGTVTPDTAIVEVYDDGFGYATFTAQAADDFRFVSWNDGSTDYSRTVRVTTDTNLTANFEPIREGNVISYCNDTLTGSLGTTDSTTQVWGIKFAGSLLSEGPLSGISYYYINDAPTTITAKIYEGGDSVPQTLLSQFTFTPDTVEGWQQFPLPSPVICDSDEMLWIILSSQSYLPCTYSYSTANPNGSIVSTDLGVTYKEEKGVTWMIRALIDTTLKVHPAVENLQATDITTTSFLVSWTKHPDGIENEWSVVVADGATAVYSNNVTVTNCTVTGLTANTAYTVTVTPRPDTIALCTPNSIEVTTLADPDPTSISNVEYITESAEAFVNMSRLYVENIAEGTHVTIIDAAGRMLYSADAENGHLEFDLTVHGVYMVVLRGKQEQILEVVY